MPYPCKHTADNVLSCQPNMVVHIVLFMLQVIPIIKQPVVCFKYDYVCVYLHSFSKILDLVQTCTA